MITGILIGLNKFNQMEVIGGNADDTLTINGPMDYSPVFAAAAGRTS
jgi:hypothetical protein